MPTENKTTSKRNGSAQDVQVSDIEAELTRLRDDISTLTKTVSDFGNGKVQSATNSVSKTSQEALEAVRDEVSSLESDFKKRVRSNPLQAIGIAAGIGFLAAMMTRH